MMYSIVFSLVYQSEGAYELFILGALLHRNPYFMELIIDLGGVDLLKDLIVDKAVRCDHPLDLCYLLNIAGNEGVSLDLTSLDSLQMVPRFVSDRMDFLDILILIIKKSKPGLILVDFEAIFDYLPSL